MYLEDWIIDKTEMKLMVNFTPILYQAWINWARDNDGQKISEESRILYTVQGIVWNSISRPDGDDPMRCGDSNTLLWIHI